MSTQGEDEKSQKVTVFLPRWMYDSIKDWETAYRPKFDQSEVVRILEHPHAVTEGRAPAAWPHPGQQIDRSRRTVGPRWG